MPEERKDWPKREYPKGLTSHKKKKPKQEQHKGGGAGRSSSMPYYGPETKGNPVEMLFPTRAAAQKYAREHGAKKFSIKKLKRGK